MNHSMFRGSRRGELGRRLADSQRQPAWHFGPRQRVKSDRSDPHVLVKRMRRQVLGGAE